MKYELDDNQVELVVCAVAENVEHVIDGIEFEQSEDGVQDPTDIAMLRAGLQALVDVVLVFEPYEDPVEIIGRFIDREIDIRYYLPDNTGGTT